jgi:L-ascorbate 6-phosphate lactonase
VNELIAQIRRTQVPAGALAIWWLGQESVIVKGGGVTLAIDPYLTDYPGGVPRRYPPLFTPDEAAGFDLCLITHDHIDHLDPWSLKGVAANSPDCQFVLPAPIMHQLEGVEPMGRVHGSRAGERLVVKGVAIDPVAAAHEQFAAAEQGHAFQSYVIELNGVRLAHMGDTVIYPGLPDTIRSLKPDVLMAPINGADWFRNQIDILGNMNYREAAELTVYAGAKLGIPMHYDLFAANAEWPGRYVDHLYQYYPTQPCKVMARGERFIYVKGD